jgi:hypothetical protein
MPLLRLPAFGIDARRALPAAVIFALHPAASSYVYPISSGRETLPVRIIALVYAWLREGRRLSILTCLSFAAALFSKELAVVVPLLFLLAGVLKLTPQGRRTVARSVPLLAVTAAYFSNRHQLFGGGEYGWGSLTGPLWAAAYALQTVVAPYAGLVY